MQVRAIEFQENFRKVPVEASRQQNVLLRDADSGRQMAAAVHAQEHAHDLTRARAFETPSESRTVDAEVERFPERRDRRTPSRKEDGRNETSDEVTQSGREHIDITV